MFLLPLPKLRVSVFSLDADLHTSVCVYAYHVCTEHASGRERQTETQKSLILLCGSKKCVHLAWLAHPIKAINKNGA